MSEPASVRDQIEAASRRLDLARAQLEAAFRRLRLRPEDLVVTVRVRGRKQESKITVKDRLRIAIDQLAGMVAAAAIPDSSATIRPESYRSVGQPTTRRELDRLAELAEAMVAHVDALHQPAILALADRHWLRGDIVAFAEGLAAAARSADISNVPEEIKQSRPVKHYARIVALTAIAHYENLTGLSADKPAAVKGGPVGLLRLVDDIFKALAIDADPKAALAGALEKRAKRRGRIIAVKTALKSSPPIIL